MKYVYLLRSLSNPKQTHIGVTENLNGRLAEHNAGKSHHTARHTPWEIEVAIRFADDKLATSFERYLKSGSGHAFAKRRFASGSPTTLPQSARTTPLVHVDKLTT